MQLDSRESGNQVATACHIGMPDLQDGEAVSYSRGAHHSSAIEGRDCPERAGIIEVRSFVQATRILLRFIGEPRAWTLSARRERTARGMGRMNKWIEIVWCR